MNLRGFPHSEIPGSKLVCSSPGLIAAYRVLHRLLAPRHSPYALSSLTTSVSNSRDDRRVTAAITSARSLLTLRLAHVVTRELERCSKRTTVCRIFSCQRTAVALARIGVAAPAHCVHRPNMVENTGLEPVTSWLQTRRSPS